MTDYALHEYQSYEDYVREQIRGNRAKLDRVWAREANIRFLAGCIGDAEFGICHGTRRGLEQQWFAQALNCPVIGTEISPTAGQFPNTVQHDFHEVRPEWVGKADFVYSNAFDHAFDPEKAFRTWMQSLRPGGICILEHSYAHEPKRSTALDPFGVTIAGLKALVRKWSGGRYRVDAVIDLPEGDDRGKYSALIIRKSPAKDPITVVCWKWKPHDGYHTKFTADHVNRLRAMVRRHLHADHHFVCVTDDREGIEAGIRIVPIGPALGKVSKVTRPNCYRRLRAFASDASRWLGNRILSLDLDCVITGDITPLVDRPDDFVIYGDTAPNTPYNGSMWLLRAGTRTKVWESFDPHGTQEKTRSMGMVGSDQAAIALALGPDEAKYGVKDGVYGYRTDIQPKGGSLPDDARIVFFFGHHDPSRATEYWVRKHWVKD